MEGKRRRKEEWRKGDSGEGRRKDEEGENRLIMTAFCS